ncbi:hypothetical protein AiwAL_15970 [Acidiphilium sp. AL]|uniref:TubC N-terminal docking domain-containing protein n=1 Tax=Acidiphilium iwatense TaxID=768198 RepID=A0ABS9E0C7_9PROT|nr:MULTISPECIES: hypothetical protein [Acidiphilium]MCF3947793.1 hypothetical protein [Acidiphilium iwatense]MCU4161579.1 hypothetical protein [Acidiphilium sp. AL]
MSAATLIWRAAEAGVTLRPRIWADGADRLPDDVRAELRAHEADIIRLLLDRENCKARGEGNDDFASPPPAELDPNEAAYASAERAAIMAEGEYGNPTVVVPHPMPVSWADATIAPTPGAYCRNCQGNEWWCEATAPKGWRCARCHPGDHLPADRRWDVRT